MGKKTTAAALICALGVAAVGNIGGVTAQMSGGQEAEIHQFPSVVSLQIPALVDGVWGLRPTNPWYCGGTILDENTVLTSARCCSVEAWVRGATPEITSKGGIVDKLRVVAGAHNLWENFFGEGEGSAQARLVSEIVRHEDFRPSETSGLAGTNPVNDICLLKLQEPFDLIPGVVEAVQLTNSDQEETGPVTRVSWGGDETDYRRQNILTFAVTDLVSDEQCQADYYLPNGNMVLPILPDEHICAHDTRVHQCHGEDQGMPMFCSDGRQCGIMSAVLCLLEFPHVFTDVSNYIDWIEANRMK